VRATLPDRAHQLKEYQFVYSTWNNVASYDTFWANGNDATGL
jgi:hypothetical protein